MHCMVAPHGVLHFGNYTATGLSCIHCEELTCFQIVNAFHDTECLNHIHASSPVQKAEQVQGSQTVLIAPVQKVSY